MTPKLSLVTGTLNRPQAFAALVASVQRHTVADWEIVVSDASDVPVECDDSRVRILPERPRLGCVKAYNRAFREASGEWILYLNDDAEVLEGYDVEAIDFMGAHPEIGLGCLYYSQNGDPFHINSAYSVPYANFGIFRKWLGEQVGFFDDDIIMYGNDNSLTFRILLAGYGVAGIPKARLLHHAINDETRRDNQKYRWRDSEVLARKYQPLKEQWLETYRRFEIHNANEEVWPHGQRVLTA
jgi:GT2 family glycosyltransferase